jgi:CheY-like chemotaxis protein
MARILLIDDDIQVITMLAKFLEYEGHTVVTVHNGNEALCTLANSTFDIVLTDIIMPELDGLEVLSFIKNMANRPKIIAMSGGSVNINQENLLRIAKLMSADEVLPKPLHLSKLAEIITDVLNR